MKAAKSALVAILTARVAGENSPGGSSVAEEATILRGQVAAKEEEPIMYPKYLLDMTTGKPLYIDVDHGICDDGKQLILHPFVHGGQNQQWYVIKEGDQVTYESAHCPGYFIAYKGSAPARGDTTMLKIYQFGDDKSERTPKCSCLMESEYFAEKAKARLLQDDVYTKVTFSNSTDDGCLEYAYNKGTLEVHTVKGNVYPWQVALMPASDTTSCYKQVNYKPDLEFN